MPFRTHRPFVYFPLFNADAFLAKTFSNESFFKDFIKLQEYCQTLLRHAVVEDSIFLKLKTTKK